MAEFSRGDKNNETTEDSKSENSLQISSDKITSDDLDDTNDHAEDTSDKPKPEEHVVSNKNSCSDGKKVNKNESEYENEVYMEQEKLIECTPLSYNGVYSGLSYSFL